MHAESGSIAAATTATVFLSVGPVPPNSRVDGVTVWFDSTDDLAASAGEGVEADTFIVSLGLGDRRAVNDSDYSVVRPMVNRLPLQSLGTPGQLYLKLAARVKLNRFVLVRVHANNGGAAAFRFGAAVDFSSGPAAQVSGLSVGRTGLPHASET